jgi:hypothetical protein
MEIREKNFNYITILTYSSLSFHSNERFQSRKSASHVFLLRSKFAGQMLGSNKKYTLNPAPADDARPADEINFTIFY